MARKKVGNFLATSVAYILSSVSQLKGLSVSIDQASNSCSYTEYLKDLL